MVRTALIARYLAYTGQWTYQVTSARLTDLTYYQWRIVGIDVLGNEATGITHAARRVVRTPDAPALPGHAASDVFVSDLEPPRRQEDRG